LRAGAVTGTAGVALIMLAVARAGDTLSARLPPTTTHRAARAAASGVLSLGLVAGVSVTMILSRRDPEGHAFARRPGTS
jgi:hypothetical protein